MSWHSNTDQCFWPATKKEIINALWPLIDNWIHMALAVGLQPYKEFSTWSNTRVSLLFKLIYECTFNPVSSHVFRSQEVKGSNQAV